tara:strand:+ start:375 stop:584 length:210 start_codon:yes stop_codon:yes gene_type:complete
MLNLCKTHKYDYRENEKVYYISENGDFLKAKIIKIHYDDIEPYYTIIFKNNNNEKQTVYKKLRPRYRYS